MNRRRVEGTALALIAAFMLPAGLNAAFWPASFFDDFPFGRGWIAAEGGTYDEHLVRDVGALFLALIVVTVWAIWRREAARLVAVAWLVQGTLHLAYHLGHLDAYDTVDRLGLVGSLVTIPALALVTLWAGRPSRPKPTGAGATP